MFSLTIDRSEGFLSLRMSDKEAPPLLPYSESELAKHIERIQQGTRSGLKTLAEHGWYLDPTGFDGAGSALAALLTKRRDEADDLLCNVVEGKADISLFNLRSTYPKRERFFRLAFDAHARGEYALSIPLLLAQADGICRERIDVQLHERLRGTGAMKLTTKLGTADEAVNLYLSPLLEEYPVAWGEQKRSGNHGVFNRHAILHGESLDFDTRVNGCKALSYLRYVGWVLSAMRVR